MARTRAEDFHEKRRAILRAAASVLAEQGGERASMARIAERAEVSKALLYHYYPGRDALVFDIIHSHLQDLDHATEAADRTELPPDKRLGQLVRTVLECYRDADDAHKVQINGTPALTQDQRAAIVALERRITRRFAAALQAVRPSLAPPRLMPVTMSLFGMMNWAYMWFRDEGPVSRAGYADMVTRLMLGGLDRLD